MNEGHLPAMPCGPRGRPAHLARIWLETRSARSHKASDTPNKHEHHPEAKFDQHKSDRHDPADQLEDKTHDAKPSDRNPSTPSGHWIIASTRVVIGEGYVDSHANPSGDLFRVKERSRQSHLRSQRR